jgi:hypothetical protein
MDRLKQTISRLEKDVDELTQYHKKTIGIPPSTGSIHYSTSSQEFGEYKLDEMDTFNFTVQYYKNINTIPQTETYIYNLKNPSAELRAYLHVQGKSFTSNQWSQIKPDDYEKYCMEQDGTPFVLTKDIRKCLESKLWAFYNETRPTHESQINKNIKNEISEDITILFKNTYKILPHVLFYLTPIMNKGITCSIKEITCKKVVFTILNNTPNEETPSELKLHYHINGIVEEAQVDELLN